MGSTSGLEKLKIFPISSLKTNSLDAAVKRYISFPVLHRWIVHARFYIVLGWIFSTLLGLSIMMRYLGHLAFADIIFWPSLAGAFFIVISSLRPCNCGKEFLLTAKTKNVLRRINAKRMIVTGLFATVVSSILTFALVSKIGLANFTLLGGLVFAVLGPIVILYSLIKVKTIMPTEQHRRVISLEGATMEELGEIFQYYLDLGYFHEAERISKLSLSLASGNNIPHGKVIEHNKNKEKNNQ
jgi:hypothetical protein